MKKETLALIADMVLEQALAYMQEGMSAIDARLTAIKEAADVVGSITAIDLGRMLQGSDGQTLMIQVGTNQQKLLASDLIAVTTIESEPAPPIRVRAPNGSTIPAEGTRSHQLYMWLKDLKPGQKTSWPFSTSEQLFDWQRGVHSVVAKYLDWGYTDRQHPVYQTYSVKTKRGVELTVERLPAK